MLGRALAGLALACGLAAAPALAVPVCEGVVDTNCWNGARLCRIYVAPTRTCTFVA